MQVVAGLNLNNLKPKVWDSQDPMYLPGLRAVMVSFADYYARPTRLRRVMETGIRADLSIPNNVEIFLDNGAFYFSKRGIEFDTKSYEDFAQKSGPDWRPIPRDYIPLPSMSTRQQRACFAKTMEMNRAFEHDGYVPVIHISPFLRQYIEQILESPNLAAKPKIALGGIVPQLLRTPKSRPFVETLDSIARVRNAFDGKDIHLFGAGGTATLHVAALIGMNSVDSSGWRNRAARGMIQLPGSGERVVADLGSWRGRKLDARELAIVESCQCPACVSSGIKGLSTDGVEGFSNRATHNLYTLLEEAAWLDEHISSGTYVSTYTSRLDNTTYRP